MKKSSKLKVALIGSTDIVANHIVALRSVGFEVQHCAASLNSTSIKQFAAQHSIMSVWRDPMQLIKCSDCWDGLVIASSISSLLPMLRAAIELNKPILVEKPIAIDPFEFTDLAKKNTDKVLVAYNRRFYSSVLKARDFAMQKENIHAHMVLPEKVDKLSANPLDPVFRNSVHGIDILQFIFGKLKVLNTLVNSKSEKYCGRQAWLKSEHGHTISLQMNWNSPANFSLNIEDGRERFQLLPFEKYSHFSGMEVIPATESYPARQFTPIEIESGTVFDGACLDLKPGFLGQAQEFYNLVNTNQRGIGANLDDAHSALTLAKEICELNLS